jgi:hypothetical protein
MGRALQGSAVAATHPILLRLDPLYGLRLDPREIIMRVNIVAWRLAASLDIVPPTGISQEPDLNWLQEHWKEAEEHLSVFTDG